MLKLQDRALNEKGERENFDHKKNEDLGTLQDTIVKVLETERNVKAVKIIYFK